MKNVKKEMKAVTNLLREDSNYYYGWQSNIAMAFYDECRRNSVRINSSKLAKIANNAAKNFLDQLMRQS